MNILADENIDRRVVELLREAGHDVMEVTTAHGGIDDDAVLALAHRARRVLLTRDRDFGELVVRQRQGCAGLILLRFRHGNPRATAEAILQVLQTEGKALTQSFAVLEKDRTRVLKLPT